MHLVISRFDSIPLTVVAVVAVQVQVEPVRDHVARAELRVAWGQSRRCLRVVEEARAGRRGRWQLGAMACVSVGCFVDSSLNS